METPTALVVPNVLAESSIAKEHIADLPDKSPRNSRLSRSDPQGSPFRVFAPAPEYWDT
jgi:hypothetical protein